MRPPPIQSIRTSFSLPQITKNDGIFLRRNSTPAPAPPSSGRISPAVLFVIVIIAIIFFISGLLHLLIRFLARKQTQRRRRRPSGIVSDAAASPAEALQRQLQQLFHLHDAGLDQSFIDALPVFPYRDIAAGSVDEPFDCAVCLCEFAADDKLRLLPACGHAFHLSCIDTWLLSNSTCPLCRANLFIPGLAIENPVFEFDGESDEERPSSRFPVRLGKFKNLSNMNGGIDGEEITQVGNGEASSSQLDARRCYSMGSYQYVVADATLQVELPRLCRRSGDSKGARDKESGGDGLPEEGKMLGITSRGESLSVSKIWQWSNKKGKHPVSSDSSDGGLPWMKERRSVGCS